MSARRTTALGVVLGSLVLAACTGPARGVPTPSSGPAAGTSAPVTSAVGTPTPSAPASTRATTAPVTTPTTAPAADAAHRVLAAMSEVQRVGQLLMVGSPAVGGDPAAAGAVARYAVGSVILTGRSHLSVTATRSVTAALRAAVPGGGAGLLVATDQEGGEVQVLQGAGFGALPSGLQQGAMSPAALQGAAATWGAALHGAGVDLDLAPVVDTVPSAADAQDNPPIGGFDREYGFDPATVAAHGAAFVRGMTAAGVDTSPKHFPGLGRVTANTDTSSGVTDTTTTRTDAYLGPFAAAISAGARVVMVGTAIYARIDPAHPAAFSSTIVTGMLRGDLHFGGVVISDDLGAAAQVADVAVGQRAVDFVAAGGDLVLTVSPDQAAAMSAALVAQAAASPAFRAQVDAAALHVLELKAARGLLS